MAQHSNVKVESFLEVQEIDGGFAVYLCTVERVYHPKLHYAEAKLARCKKLSPVWGDEAYARRMMPGYKL